jgi:hypothetical protein
VARVCRFDGTKVVKQPGISAIRCRNIKPFTLSAGADDTRERAAAPTAARATERPRGYGIST